MDMKEKLVELIGRTDGTCKRLIDANALLEEMDKFANPMPNKSGYEFLRGIATAITEIEDAPTVDAVEVVHGRWVLQRYYGGVRKGIVARVICSECGYPNEKTNYCPSCGAMMDGGNDDGSA